MRERRYSPLVLVLTGWVVCAALGVWIMRDKSTPLTPAQARRRAEYCARVIERKVTRKQTSDIAKWFDDLAALREHSIAGMWILMRSDSGYVQAACGEVFARLALRGLLVPRAPGGPDEVQITRPAAVRITAQIEPLLRQGLASKHGWVRAYYLPDGFWYLPDGLAVILRATRDPESSATAYAIMADDWAGSVGIPRRPKLEEAICAGLHYGPASVRATAILAAARLRVRVALPELLDALVDERPAHVGSYGVSELIHMPGNHAESGLSEHLVCHYAAYAIQQITGNDFGFVSFQQGSAEMAEIIERMLDCLWPECDPKSPVMRRFALARRLGLPVTRELHLDGGTAIKLSLIPPGEFLMGSPVDEPERYRNEGPQHIVRITKPFYMSVEPITDTQCRTVVDAPLRPETDEDLGGEAPYHISWTGADEFCRQLSASSGRTVRLPTEAEWEWACRGTSTQAFCFADDRDVREYHVAHPWALSGKGGDVDEWCQDWYSGDYYAISPVEDPVGSATGSTRVVREGMLARCAERRAADPGSISRNISFRIVMPVE